MHQIDDKTLEDCRKFLSLPGQKKTPNELFEIVRNLLWAVEELQFRRLAEKTPVVSTEDARPYLLFGSDEAVLQFVEEHKIPDEKWKQVSKEEDFRGLHPPEIRSRKLDGADEKLWKEWEGICHTYDAKPEGSA